MSALLDQIKAANDALHTEVVNAGNRVSQSLTDLNAKIADLQTQLANGQQVSQADLDEAAQIVAQAQQDTAQLSNIDNPPAA